MAIAMLPVRSDPASSAARKSFLDDDEGGPFMLEPDDYDEEPPPPKASIAMFPNTSTDMFPNSSTSDMPPSDNDISANLDQQMMPGSGVASDVIAGDVATCNTRKNALPSSPTGTNMSFPN